MSLGAVATGSVPHLVTVAVPAPDTDAGFPPPAPGTDADVPPPAPAPPPAPGTDAGVPPSETAPPPPDREPFTPPPGYAELWQEVQRCSGLAADAARLRWYRVPSFPDRPLRLAQWEPGHTITLRDDIVIALPIVAHEMLHDLLGGDRQHEDPAWRTCALPVAGAGSD